MAVKVVSIIMFVMLTGCACFAANWYLNKNRKETETDTAEERKLCGTRSNRFFPISMALAVIIGAVIGTAIYDRTTSLLNFYKVALIFSLTWAIAITDIKLGLIPNVFTLTMFGAGLVFHVIDLINTSFSRETVNQILIYYVALAAVVLVVLLILSATTHSGMGAGDIKYLTALCFTGGIMLLLTALSVALLIGLIYGLVIMIIRKRKIRDTIPFGPFILIGVIVCILTGLM